ncbi:hypothetical protein [Alteromonas flava]|uniref:hypothetical protein n=1 Tax=Alteromonas flava TaxID=2048003 RepID=UPI000C28E189|nr:hypothetical protein [Alteromonas flava]
MKKLHFASIGAVVLSLSAVCNNTLASDYPLRLETDLVSVCRLAAENDRVGLHQAVQKITPGHRAMGPTYKMLGEGLLCNGKQVTTFARQFGATDTVKAFQRYNPATPVIEIRDLEVSQHIPSDIYVSFALGK